MTAFRAVVDAIQLYWTLGFLGLLLCGIVVVSIKDAIKWWRRGRK